jgi:hypothetical protein
MIKIVERAKVMNGSDIYGAVSCVSLGEYILGQYCLYHKYHLVKAFTDTYCNGKICDKVSLEIWRLSVQHRQSIKPFLRLQEID